MTTPGQTYELAATASLAAGPALSPGRLLWRRFLRHHLAVAALGLLTVFVEAALGLDATAINLLARSQGPSAAHPLGTDELGRDLLLRLLYGGRVSLGVGLAAALCAASIGTLLGLLAGYFGGRLDALLMRLADSVIALPLLPLLIVLAALDPAKLGLPAGFADSEAASFYRIVLLIALVGWTTTARLVRGADDVQNVSQI